MCLCFLVVYKLWYGNVFNLLSIYLDAFSYSFCLQFGDFIQLQKPMCGIKIVMNLAINLLSSIDPS